MEPEPGNGLQSRGGECRRGSDATQVDVRCRWSPLLAALAVAALVGAADMNGTDGADKIQGGDEADKIEGRRGDDELDGARRRRRDQRRTATRTRSTAGPATTRSTARRCDVRELGYMCDNPGNETLRGGDGDDSILANDCVRSFCAEKQYIALESVLDGGAGNDRVDRRRRERPAPRRRRRRPR